MYCGQQTVHLEAGFLYSFNYDWGSRQFGLAWGGPSVIEQGQRGDSSGAPVHSRVAETYE